MPRPKTHSERSLIIQQIISLVKENGRMTTADVVEKFDLHRTTAQKYLRIAVQRGGVIRHSHAAASRTVPRPGFSKVVHHRIGLQKDPLREG